MLNRKIPAGAASEPTVAEPHDAIEELVGRLRASDAPPRAATRHDVRFERNTGTGMWRATCSCGWLTVGTQGHVQAQAGSHDLWEPANV